MGKLQKNIGTIVIVSATLLLAACGKSTKNSNRWVEPGNTPNNVPPVFNVDQVERISDAERICARNFLNDSRPDETVESIFTDFFKQPDWVADEDRIPPVQDIEHPITYCLWVDSSREQNLSSFRMEYADANVLAQFSAKEILWPNAETGLPYTDEDGRDLHWKPSYYYNNDPENFEMIMMMTWGFFAIHGKAPTNSDSITADIRFVRFPFDGSLYTPSTAGASYDNCLGYASGNTNATHNGQACAEQFLFYPSAFRMSNINEGFLNEYSQKEQEHRLALIRQYFTDNNSSLTKIRDLGVTVERLGSIQFKLDNISNGRAP